MDDYRFTQYDFERPPRIQLIAEELIFGLLGNLLWYGPLVRFIDLKGTEKMLDFGCGSGFLMKCLARSLLKDGKVTGIDSSKFYIQRAKKKLDGFNNIELIEGDINHIDVPDYSFDVITINYVIHDIAPGKRTAVIMKLAEKLNNTGRIYISEPTKKSHGIAASELRKLFCKSGLREADFKENRKRYIGCWER